jgi:phage tail sheath protein FI
MAFFYPHIKVEDPADAGLTVTISPETFAAAARSKAINEAGSPHRAGAGLISAASSYVKGIEDGYAVDKAAGDLLDEARVNAIRSIGGSIRVYGARSLSTDEANWRFITFQDMVNHIAVEAEERLEDFVFSTIDSRGGLFGQIRGSMIAMLDPHRISGGLYEAFDAGGERVDPGYSVVVNDDNNPASQLANGQVKVDVGIRVSSVGDKINVTITKSNLTASVV